MAVETAVLTPPLVLLTLLAVDFGRAYRFEMIVRQAAHAGAAHGATRTFSTVTQSEWEMAVREEVNQNMQDLSNFDANLLTTDVTTFEESIGVFRVQVQVHYPFETIVPWPGLPERIELEATSHYRRFQ